MKPWIALLGKEISESWTFLALMLGGTILLEGYAALRASEHIGAALLAFIPLWAIVFLIPVRFTHSMSLERRGQTLHLLYSLPFPAFAPVFCKVFALLVFGSLTVCVALAGIHTVYGQVQEVLRFPGFPQVSGEAVAMFSGLGTVVTMVLFLGVAVAVDGLRVSLKRFQWLGTAAFLLAAAIAYLVLLPDGLRLFHSAALLGEGLGRAYFAYSLCFGLSFLGIGLALTEAFGEI